MEPMFSLKLGIDLTSGLAAGATLGSLAPSIDLWAASIASFSISVVVGIIDLLILVVELEDTELGLIVSLTGVTGVVVETFLKI